VDAIVLFGHGARDPEWARPLERLRELVLARHPGLDVRLAFLEFMQPGLADALEAAAAQGASSVRVVPVFLAQGGHVKRDVPEILAAVRQKHPSLKIELTTALGETAAVLAAMAEEVLRPD
jgi:sirohydrochlorin cobaltochelatase